MHSEKIFFFFDEITSDMQDIVGIKGVNLAEMTKLNLNIPEGFIISSSVFKYYKINHELPSHFLPTLRECLVELSAKIKKSFFDNENFFLLAVRACPAISMPGMLDSIINIGLNEERISKYIAGGGSAKFILDCYRKFIQMYAACAMDVSRDEFIRIFEEVKDRFIMPRNDKKYDEKSLEILLKKYKKLITTHVNHEIPNSPEEQLLTSIESIYKSWNNPRAITYRNLHKISNDTGFAIGIQRVVFGNKETGSASGVVFTRDPSNGQKNIYGEYFSCLQGADLLPGETFPQAIQNLANEMPDACRNLLKACERLETHYLDVQTIEFVIENEKLFIVQATSARRTSQAAIKFAVDMYKEKLISKEEALLRVEPTMLEQILHSYVDPQLRIKSIARGIPTSPGAVSGAVVFDSHDAVSLTTDRRKDVILVKDETSPDDIKGVSISKGILTTKGGKTSHIAVVARGMGKPCICGCETIKIDYRKKLFSVGETIVKEGDIITIDGSTGRVYIGSIPIQHEPAISFEFRELLNWADEIRKLSIRANADSPEDAERAREFGAEGIGLARTEYMFMAADRIPVVRAMIMSETQQERRDELKKLIVMQKQDFIDIFRLMAGLPVTIRLLDPPLHEFLPPLETILMEVAALRASGSNPEELEKKETILKKVQSLKEVNPMIGFRGCRLGILFPEIYEMQAVAIFEAACELVQEDIEVNPEIMIPLVGHVNELKRVREQLETIAKKIMDNSKVIINYSIGTMIEIPRAALTADEIVEYADFFSFGTNDLTQTVFGFSRDDAEKRFLLYYLDQNILEENPFEVLDKKSVGRLMEIAIESAHKKKVDFKIGLCGEHGGEYKSIYYCHQIGIDYISCSAYRIPVAKLSAAQAQIMWRR